MEIFLLVVGVLILWGVFSTLSGRQKLAEQQTRQAQERAAAEREQAQALRTLEVEDRFDDGSPLDFRVDFREMTLTIETYSSDSDYHHGAQPSPDPAYNLRRIDGANWEVCLREESWQALYEHERKRWEDDPEILADTKVRRGRWEKWTHPSLTVGKLEAAYQRFLLHYREPVAARG
jgi:hypothetical protein